MNLLPSLFSRYSLSEQEQLEGSILSPNQQAVLQNLLADMVEEKVLLKFDPASIQQFQQREAELQGQIGIIKFILATSDEAIETKQSQLNNSINPTDQ
jgi:hypothetical protein